MAFDWNTAEAQDDSATGQSLPVGALGSPGPVATAKQTPVGGAGFDWGSAREDAAAFDWSSAASVEDSGRVSEFLSRVGRGARQGVEDVKAGLYGLVSEFTGDAKNPYRELGADQLKSKRVELVDNLNLVLEADARQDGATGINPEVQRLRHAIRQVDDSQTGHAPWEEVTTAATADLAADAQEKKRKVSGEYVGKIAPARSGEFWMKVADSVGGSLPVTGASMLNPMFGLSLMFGQTYEGARGEFAAKNEGSPDDDAAHEYALKQAAFQTPWEVVGDVAFAGVAKKALGGLLKKSANPEAIGDWIKERAFDLGKAAAGETLVTTPAQTLGEQMLAESEGVRDQTSTGEKVSQVGEAMKVAAAQSLFMGGGPVAIEGAGRAITGGFTAIPEGDLPRARDLRAAGDGLAEVSVENFDWSSAEESGNGAPTMAGIPPERSDSTNGASFEGGVESGVPSENVAPVEMGGHPDAAYMPRAEASGFTDERATVPESFQPRAESPIEAGENMATVEPDLRQEPVIDGLSEARADNIQRDLGEQAGGAGRMSAPIFEGLVDHGRKVYRQGVEFSEWAGRMVADLGESVRAFLEEIWKTVSGERFLPHARERAAVDFSDALSEVARDRRKVRGFVDSVQQSEAVEPSVRERVQGVYEPMTNRETVENARQWVDGLGLDAALVKLLGNESPTAQDYAAGIDMLARLQVGGRFDDAAALVERMAESATGQGQAIQALSLLSKLTPEGIQFYAGRVIRRAVAKNPLLEKLHGEVSRLRVELMKARKAMAKSAIVKARVRGGKETVQQRLQRLLIDNPGSIWGRHKAGAVRDLASKLQDSNQRPDLPALAAFTSRLKQQLREQMGGNRSGQRRSGLELSEAEMIGEAVRNFDKYQEVWKDAQAFVLEKFKGDDEALQKMDSFLGQILERPFSEKSVGRSIRQVLDEMNLSMHEVLTQSSGDKGRVLKTLQSMIVERAGVRESDAFGLAAAIRDEFESQQKAARAQLLAAMVATKAVQVPKSKLQKLIELNNAGALDDARFFATLAKHYGIPAWTPELSGRVQRLQLQYEAAVDPEIKLAKAAQMFDAVHELVPADAWARVRSVQNIAMLLNPKTLIRNIGGNVALFAADVPADALSSWVVDPLVSIFTGERTRRSVDVAARVGGLAAPVKDFWKGWEFSRKQGFDQRASIRAGVDQLLTMARLSARGKYDLAQVQKGNSRVFSNRAGRMLEDALTISLLSFDRAFHQAAFKASLQRQMRVAQADGETMIAPTNAMIEAAMMDAARATFQDENFASKALSKISKAVNVVSTLGITDQYGLGSVVLPFTQVPGSILMRGVEWSPIGAIRASYELLRGPLTRQEFRQKEFVDAFSRAMLGSVGVATGLWLYKIGVVTALPEEDDDLEKMRQASGLGQFRLNAAALKRALITGNWWARQVPEDGDVTVNYDWLQPNAMSLAMGAAVGQRQEVDRREALRGLSSPVSGGAGLTVAAGRAAVRTLEEQPLLMGLARYGRDIGREGVMTGTAMQALDAPGMFVPTFIGQVGQLMDNQVRETRAGGPLAQTVNRLMARIPGLSEKFPARYDIFGEAQARYSYGGNSLFNVMLNPAFLDRVKMNPALREMESVFAATGDRSALPRRAPVKLAFGGGRVDLTNEQISQYQFLSGQLAVRAYANLAASPAFAKAPAGAKAAVLVKLMSGINDAVKREVLEGNPELKQRLGGQILQQVRAEAALMQP